HRALHSFPTRRSSDLTTFQQDLANADAILIMGSNMAENHPVGFRWPMKARERGATIIHVDPRFSRTSAAANLYVPIRSGSDIALDRKSTRLNSSHDQI